MERYKASNSASSSSNDTDGLGILSASAGPRHLMTSLGDRLSQGAAEQVQVPASRGLVRMVVNWIMGVPVEI